MDKFWLVWREETGHIINKHETMVAARTEATRLARANPGAYFFVIEAIESVVREEVTVKILENTCAK